MTRASLVNRTRLARSLAVVAAAVLVCSSVSAAARGGGGAADPKQRAPERGRVRIKDNTVVSDRGTLLRGPAVWHFKWGNGQGWNDYAVDAAHWREVRRHGANGVRIICFDPWQRSNKFQHHDLRDEKDRTAFLERLDRIVDLASAHGMYALVNYHDVGKYDMEYATKFWELVAPRYKDRTHVFYEVSNEPVPWYPEQYTREDLDKQEAVYKLVRGLAPETHVVLLSFANTHSFDPNKSMRTTAEQLRGVDWSNASVGFHPYNTNKSSESILELKAKFPVICTEGNIPDGPDGKLDGMDGDQWVIQGLERVGVSWFAWQMEGPKKFRQNWIEGVRKDAEAKGYLWEPDHGE